MLFPESGNINECEIVPGSTYILVYRSLSIFIYKNRSVVESWYRLLIYCGLLRIYGEFEDAEVGEKE